MPRRVSRREFLGLCLATVSSTVLGACLSGNRQQPTASPTATPSPTAPPTATPAATPIATATPAPSATPVPAQAPFGVWATLRDAVRQSPDHLLARAAALVTEGDPAAIYAFVRDNIRVQPLRARNLNAETVMEGLWGPRATLRSGAGSFRDKADLLAGLLAQAGFKAEVVKATVNWQSEQVREIILRPAPREFAPQLEGTTVEALLAAMKSGQEPPRPPLAPEEVASQAAAAADSLVAAFPPGEDVYPFAYPAVETAPIVRVKVDGENRFANPFVADGVFGEHYAAEAPKYTANPPGPKAVEVSLLVSYSSDPGQRITVAEGSWAYADVIGRQIVAQFLPALEVEEMVGRKAGDVHAFLPALILRGPKLPPEEAQKLSIVERMITAGADIIEADEHDTVTVNGQPLETAALGQAPRVARLEMTIRATAFPRIVGEVRAFDDAGRPVQGLVAGDFRLGEDGQALGMLLCKNQVSPPRVLMVLDNSGSIPEAFREEGLVETGRTLVERLLEEYPEARVGAMVIQSSQPSTWFDKSSTRERIESRLAGLSGAANSDLWRTLRDANRVRPDVILLVTDGQNTDELTAEARRAVVGGAPIVALGVGEIKQETLDLVAELSGGVTLAVSQPEEAMQAALEYLKTQQDVPIAFAYYAPLEGAETRTVALAVVESEATAEAQYTAPAQEERGTAEICGIYLAVQAGPVKVLRTLAGYESYQRRDPVTPADTEAAFAGLFGSAVLTFEGMPPLVSPLLDDVLTARLTLKPVAEALAGGDAEAVYQAWGGVLPVLSDALAMQMPLVAPAGDPSFTFATTPRIVLHHALPTPQGTVRRIDVLELSHWGTAADDPLEGYRKTAARTAQLAVIEASRFQTSALSLLSGHELAEVEPYSTRLGLGVPDELLGPWHLLVDPASRDYRIFAPAGGQPVAMWMQHAGSGELVAVLPDGSGGGRSDDETKPFDRALDLLELADLVGGLLGASLGFGVWLAFEKTLIKKLRAATILLDSLPTTPGEEAGGGSGLPPEADDALRDLFSDIYSNLVDSIVGGAFPDYKYLGALDKIVNMASDGERYVIPFPLHAPASGL